MPVRIQKVYTQPVGWVPSAGYQGLSSATTLSSRSTGSSENGSSTAAFGSSTAASAKSLVVLVAGQQVKQVAGQQRPNVFCEPRSAPGKADDRSQSATLDQPAGLDLGGRCAASRSSTPATTRRRWTAGSSDRRDEVRIRPGTVSRGGGLLGRRLGDRGVHREDGLRLGGHSRRGEHRRGCPEAVTCDAQFGRVHADLTRAQPHARDDVQRRAQVVGQSRAPTAPARSRCWARRRRFPRTPDDPASRGSGRADVIQSWANATPGRFLPVAGV